jgi:carbon starvation protein
MKILSNRTFVTAAVAILGAGAFGGIALNRGETVNALWFVVAAVCVYIVAYRLYAGWIAAKVLVLDPTRATPAERLDNGRDFVPTHRWIVFGHHFAAIAGAGPLIGPTLAVAAGRRGARRLRAGHGDPVLFGTT